MTSLLVNLPELRSNIPLPALLTVQDRVAEAAPSQDDGSEPDYEDVLDTGNEHDVGVEPYEAWCSALRALEWENPDSIPAVGSALSVTGYMPFSPALRRLGDALVMDEFFQNLGCSVESVKPLKDWLTVRVFVKNMMMSTPQGQLCPESLNAQEDRTLEDSVGTHIFT